MLESKDLLGLVAGLVGVASAWIAYKTKVRESQARKESKQLVLAIGSPAASATKWVRWKFIAFLLIAVLAIQFTAAWFVAGPHAVFSAIFLFSMVGGSLVGLVLTLAWEKLRPASVRYSTDVLVALEPARAIEVALSAVRQLGAEIDHYDAAGSKLSARIPWYKSMLFGTTLLYVEVASVSTDHSNITVVCDSPNPFARFDFGANRRVARRVVNTILGL